MFGEDLLDATAEPPAILGRQIERGDHDDRDVVPRSVRLQRRHQLGQKRSLWLRRRSARRQRRVA